MYCGDEALRKAETTPSEPPVTNGTRTLEAARKRNKDTDNFFNAL
jgi:hypothetical protein